MLRQDIESYPIFILAWTHNKVMTVKVVGRLVHKYKCCCKWGPWLLFEVWKFKPSEYIGLFTKLSPSCLLIMTTEASNINDYTVSCIFWLSLPALTFTSCINISHINVINIIGRIFTKLSLTSAQLHHWIKNVLHAVIHHLQ